MESAGEKFARELLAKYGWKQGKGLGKNENGIAEPIRQSLKFDATGVGYKHGQEFSFHWWDHAFNSAAKRISVDNSEFGVTVKICDTNMPTATACKTPADLKYGSFIKTEELLTNGRVKQILKATCREEAEDNLSSLSSLSADEILSVCRNCTAHKAARHGLKLNGKLRRLEQQEMEMLKETKLKIGSKFTGDNSTMNVVNSEGIKRIKPVNSSNSDDSCSFKKGKKHKRKSSRHLIS